MEIEAAKLPLYVLAAAVTGIVALLWSTGRRHVQLSRLSHTYGCLAPARYPRWGAGVALWLDFRRADRKGQRSKAYQDVHRKHGTTLEMTILGQKSIQTAHPQNIQAICATNFDDYGVEPMRGKIGKPFIDRGIFRVDGDYWRHSRALIRPTFARNEIADLDNFETYVQRMLALIPEDGSTFDVTPLTKRLFLDTSTEFIFGQSVDSLRPDTSGETYRFMECFTYALQGLASTYVLGPLKFLVYINPRWIEAYKTVHGFVDGWIQDAFKRQEKANSKARKCQQGRDKYILVDEMISQTNDLFELRHQLINVFYPARDTTALAFGNVIFYLSRHPTWWQKLRDEVHGIDDEPLTFELVRNLKVVRAIINETTRLHPAASRIGRIALKDTVLPKGGGPDGESPLLVPKGHVVEMNLYVIQRNPKFYGSDAEEFRPERWREGRPLWEAKWQYEPFLGGIRMCPAQNMVLTQLSYLLIRFAQTFKTIECRDPVAEYKERIAMTVESRNGAKIAVWRDEQRTP